MRLYFKHWAMDFMSSLVYF